MGVHEWDPADAGRVVGAEPGVPGAVVSVSRGDAYSFSKPNRDEITLIAGLGVAGDVHAGVTVRHRSRVAVDPAQPNLRQVHLVHAELHDELRPEGYEVPAGGLGENVTTVGIDLLGLPVGTILRFGPAPAGEGAPAPAGPAARRPGTSPRSGQEAGETPLIGPVGGAAAVLDAAADAILDASTAAAVAALAAHLEAGAATDRPSAARSAAGRSCAEQPVAPPGDTRPAVLVTGLRNPCQQINTYRAGLLKHVLGRDSRGRLVRKAGVMAVVLRGGAVRPGDAVSVELPALPHLPLDRV